jgi:outer membrane usher protein
VTAGSTKAAIATTADGLGPILVPDIPAYSSRGLTFEIENADDAAMGADVPPVRFHAPYKAGHRVTLGSENSLTAVGTLIGADGAPLALAAGYARAQSSPVGDPLELFTNRTGRFAVHGVGPGNWIIEIAHEGGPLRYMLTIPEAGSGLHQAGALRPIP